MSSIPGWQQRGTGVGAWGSENAGDRSRAGMSHALARRLGPNTFPPNKDACSQCLAIGCLSKRRAQRPQFGASVSWRTRYQRTAMLRFKPLLEQSGKPESWRFASNHCTFAALKGHKRAPRQAKSMRCERPKVSPISHAASTGTATCRPTKAGMRSRHFT